jgi:serine/threonine protein kinase
MVLTPGTRFDVYDIIDLLGAGGMGQVYRARDSRLGREVALKVVRSDLAQDPDRLERLEREARLLASLNHPNIATLHGLGETDGVRFLIMELVPGLTLAQRLEQGALPVKEALAIAKQIAEGLEAAHDRGVVHRDLKPANIKLTADGRVKILDFGLAKAVGPVRERSQSTIDEPATLEGAVLGTPAYMSPEQTRGKPADKRTDIWAFGCILYEMLAGRSAFRATTVADTYVAILERELDWACLPDALPGRIRDLLGRCLQKNLQRRRRDIGDVRLEIEETIKEAAVAPVTEVRRRAGKAQGNASRRKPAATASTPEASLADFENPYEFDTTANSRTFKGRATELDELVEAISSGTHTAIFGLQRMGKTSLIDEGLKERLEQIPGTDKNIVLVKIDLQGLGGEQVKYRDLLHACIEAITEKLSDQGIGRAVEDLRGLTNELFAASRYERGDRTQFFSMFGKLLHGFADAAHRRIVLFIDEFSEVRKVIERNKIALQRNPRRTGSLLPHDMYIDVPFMHHLSSLLKDRDLKRRFTLIVLVRPFMAEYDEKEGLQILKLMKPITLYYLDEEAARALITQPLQGHIGYEPRAVDYLWRLTAGHPYLLQFILKLIVDRAKRERRATVTLTDIQALEERMLSEGPAYDALFAVLISDYSVAEIMHPQEALLGKGTLALIAKLGDEQPEGWVLEEQIFARLAEHKIPREKAAFLLSQLARTKILEEQSQKGALRYRLSIPLLRKRFVRQNLYLKFFR